jgi:hypothetical protein
MRFELNKALESKTAKTRNGQTVTQLVLMEAKNTTRNLIGVVGGKIQSWMPNGDHDAMGITDPLDLTSDTVKKVELWAVVVDNAVRLCGSYSDAVDRWSFTKGSYVYKIEFEDFGDHHVCVKDVEPLPFDLKLAVEGHPVRTRGGKNVTQLVHFKCSDSEYNVYAVMHGSVYSWMENGAVEASKTSQDDLVMKNDKKWMDIVRQGDGYFAKRLTDMPSDDQDVVAKVAINVRWK